LPGIEGPDVVTLFSRVGKGLGRLFKPRRSEDVKALPQSDHNLSYGVVYANDIAALEINNSTPRFPVGSILVRERLTEPTSPVPTAVIVMLKRPAGFSKATGDWEFFMMNGADMKLVSRETTGNCAACHTRAEKTDWVFMDQLKK
jgi:hypothetical protein